MSGATPLFPLYHFTVWVGTTSLHFFYLISKLLTAVGDICCSVCIFAGVCVYLLECVYICWCVCIFSSFVSNKCTVTTVLEKLLVPE